MTTAEATAHRSLDLWLAGYNQGNNPPLSLKEIGEVYATLLERAKKEMGRKEGAVDHWTGSRDEARDRAREMRSAGWPTATAVRIVVVVGGGRPTGVWVVRVDDGYSGRVLRYLRTDGCVR
jgi:hypothetical protein